MEEYQSLILSAAIIMCLRIIDVSLGTVRMLMTVQGRKYIAGLIGFFEVTIWVIAIRHIMQNLDNIFNIFGYSSGFALGTILGITIEQKLGAGFIYLHVISMNYADKIADELRKNKFGVTMLPGEGGSGGVAVLMVLVKRKRQREIMDLIESIDAKAFITVNSAVPHRGYVQTKT
jgi:uncharacterized protein YebE (UPF0316 family)